MILVYSEKNKNWMAAKIRLYAVNEMASRSQLIKAFHFVSDINKYWKHV